LFDGIKERGKEKGEWQTKAINVKRLESKSNAENLFFEKQLVIEMG